MNQGIPPSKVTEWKSWSPHHIQSAALLARAAYPLEATREYSNERIVVEHRAYVTASIFASVAFLEAAINELFAEAAAIQEALKRPPWDQWPMPYGPAIELGADARAALSALNPHPQFLRNYQAVLRVVGAPTFDQAAPPYEDLDQLRELRNELLHYRPRWETTLDIHDAMSVKAREFYGKFPPNGLVPPNMPENLDRHLGHGCAAWAVESALLFTDEFYRRLDVTPLHKRFRSTFGTEP